jgi:ABC-2 type transport system ATP-binding protein
MIRMDDQRDRSSDATVSVTGLCKRYGAAEAVCDISFEVGSGQIFGLLGPNGAGKTTTIECILGLRRPDAGSIRINGLDLRTQATQAKLLVGAQLQAATLQDKITPRQALELFGSFYSEPFAAGELLRRFKLEDKGDAPFATLSGGQRQRLFLALALINRPSLLVLDEPTAGLDPQARRALRIMIQEMRAEARTVLLSTHDLDEAAQLCDQVAIMDGGRIIAVAPPAELIARSTSLSRVIVRTAPPLGRTLVDSLPNLHEAICRNDSWVLNTATPNRLLADLVRRADEAGAELLDVQVRRPSLEDVFIELTGHSWSGEESRGDLS